MKLVLLLLVASLLETSLWTRSWYGHRNNGLQDIGLGYYVSTLSILDKFTNKTHTCWTMMKGATAAPWVFINLLLNKGTFVSTGEEMIISLFLNVLLLFFHFLLCSQHVRFSFLLGADENIFYYNLDVHSYRKMFLKKRNKCETQALTCLLGEMFHLPPGRSDIISPCGIIRQAASLSLTCLMPSLDWKTIEINNPPD